MKRAQPGFSAAPAAFTLIEILITIAVIVLLVGMLFPALSMIRKANNRAISRITLENLKDAITNYLHDFPNLGNANDASDFVASPLTFLYRNPIATGQPPYYEPRVAHAATGSPTLYQHATNLSTADQVLDAFGEPVQFQILNSLTVANRLYTYDITMFSQVGTDADTTDDIVLHYHQNPLGWDTRIGQ